MGVQLPGFAIILTIAWSLLSGCSQSSPGTSPTGGVTNYPVKGIVKELRSNGKQALVTHETIPGYMDAMTMVFDAHDPNELRNLQPGDAITFDLRVTATDGWMEHIRKIPSPSQSANPSNSNPAPTSIRELEAGAPIPDCLLTNQSGQAFHLQDWKGRAFAFTFIFTRCPFPVYCPRMNTNLGAAQEALSQSRATNWHLLSISFDPEFDTPARLAEYAQGYHPDPTRWTFATGSTGDIRRLGTAFGLAFQREGTLSNHNVRTVVVDTRGLIQHVFAGNDWKPSELIEELQKAMQPLP